MASCSLSCAPSHHFHSPPPPRIPSHSNAFSGCPHFFVASPRKNPHRCRGRSPSVIVSSSSSSISNSREAYAREERKREMMERYGLDLSQFDSPSPRKPRGRRTEADKEGRGKRVLPPTVEPKTPRSTHKLLQVLGGKARRKKLLSPKGMDVRPMMEVVRGGWRLSGFIKTRPLVRLVQWHWFSWN